MSYSIDDYILFIGGDVALHGDYFGIAVHALPREQPKDKLWLPYLIKLIKLQAPNYRVMWAELTEPEGVLYPYRNFYNMNMDYTTEKTFTDFLEGKFGASRITKTPFTKGESGTKMQIYQSALSFLKSGYTFPDHNKISDPKEKEVIRTLKQQAVNEEIILNSDGSVKFRHKGKHNDLLHAWMLSLDGVRKFILQTQHSKDTYRDYPTEEIPLDDDMDYLDDEIANTLRK